MLGFKSHYLTVISQTERPAHRRDRNLWWKCLCICGKETSLSTSALNKGTIKSCGCIKTMPEWGIAVSKRNQKPLEKVAINILLNNYKRSAKQRQYTFSLSETEFKFLIEQSCSYCGIRSGNYLRLPRKYEEAVYYYNGLDRQDNTKGYTLENCVSCCKHCNTAKMDRTQEDFLSWISKVYLFQGQSK